MFTHLHKKSRFTEDQARVYIGEIVLALERLHEVRPGAGEGQGQGRVPGVGRGRGGAEYLERGWGRGGAEYLERGWG